jgi:ABC-type transporter Mla subunit MlaD
VLKRRWRDMVSRRRKVPPHGHPQLRKRIRSLERDNRRLGAALENRHQRLVQRIAELEGGLQEQRALSPRIAELTDLVTTLVAAAARGEQEFRKALDDAARTLPDPRA